MLPCTRSINYRRPHWVIYMVVERCSFLGWSVLLPIAAVRFSTLVTMVTDYRITGPQAIMTRLFSGGPLAQIYGAVLASVIRAGVGRHSHFSEPCFTGAAIFLVNQSCAGEKTRAQSAQKTLTRSGCWQPSC